jgi:hypothetical protein
MTGFPNDHHRAMAHADHGPVDLEELVRRQATRSEAIERRQAQAMAWMKRLDRRLRHVESRLAELAAQAADQHEATRMICAILRDLDDPYGFGVSLDERLVRDESERMLEEEG